MPDRLSERLTVRPWDGVHGRLIAEDPYARESLTPYLAAGGYGMTDALEVAQRARIAELCGRGGAGFPLWRKLAAVRENGAGGTTVVVANGEEGEPASVKDRYLLRMRPHLVLDGLRQAALSVGATEGYVYVSDPGAAKSVADALAEYTFDDLEIFIHQVEHTYVAGEETAVVQAINGGPAIPTAKPPRPFQSGVGARPTLVANVETLAQLALLSRHENVAHQGTESSASTFLATLSSPAHGPLLCELPFGVTVEAALSWASFESIGGLIIGGFFGGLLHRNSGAVPLSYQGLRERGSGLGCGAIVALGRDECPVSAAADVVAYLAAESSQQCGSCIRGTAAMEDLLTCLLREDAEDRSVSQLATLAGRLPGRGACGLLDAAAASVRSLLREFPADIAAHVERNCSKLHPGQPNPQLARVGGHTRYALNCFDPLEDR